MGSKLWTEEENIILKDNYLIKTEEELLQLLPGRTFFNIKVHWNKNFNDVILRRAWTLEEDEFLIHNYHNLDKNKLIENFNRSWDAIKLRAGKLRIKRSNDFVRHSKLDVLLDETCINYYWLGFLLADGHFDTKSSRLVFWIDKKDRDQVIKFCEHIKADIKNVKIHSVSDVRIKILFLKYARSLK